MFDQPGPSSAAVPLGERRRRRRAHDLRVLGQGREWVAPRGSLEAVEGEVVPATRTSMAFFDRLEEADPPVVRGNGDLVKCFDSFIDGVQISDLLRDMLLNEESEHA